MKRCSKGEQCVHPDGADLPATRQFFIVNNKCSDGFEGVCRQCRRRQDRDRKALKLTPEYQQKQQEKAIKQAAGEKWCNGCKRWLPANSEYFCKSDAKHKWHPRCKKCEGAQRRDRMLNDPEFAKRMAQYARAYGKEWYKKAKTDPAYKQRKKGILQRLMEKPEYRARIYQLTRESRKRMKEKPGYIERAREKARYHARRSLKHPEALHYRRVYNQYNRTALTALPNDFSREDWQRALDYWGHKCAICGQIEDGSHVLAPDHWIPISDPRPNNPGNVPDNIVPLCHTRKGAGIHYSCNQTKGSKDPLEWLTDKLGQSEFSQTIARIETYFEWVRCQSR